MANINFEFSTNWNNKLECDNFTTIRFHQPNRHVPGTVADITLKGTLKKNAVIVAVKPLLVTQINDFIGYLDTGYSGKETQDILRTMYKNKQIDWQRQLFDLVLLKTVIQ
jgi:hypothetical protein